MLDATCLVRDCYRLLVRMVIGSLFSNVAMFSRSAHLAHLRQPSFKPNKKHKKQKKTRKTKKWRWKMMATRIVPNLVSRTTFLSAVPIGAGRGKAVLPIKATMSSSHTSGNHVHGPKGRVNSASISHTTTYTGNVSLVFCMGSRWVVQLRHQPAAACAWGVVMLATRRLFALTRRDAKTSSPSIHTRRQARVCPAEALCFVIPRNRRKRPIPSLFTTTVPIGL